MKIAVQDKETMNIKERLSDVWSAVRGKPTTGEHAVQAHVVSLRKELGELGLELAEVRDLQAAQRSRLEEIARNEKNQPTDALADLFGSLAAPLSQLRLQASLLESGKEISGRSVMALAAQLADLLESAGLEPIGATGHEIQFDPQTCEPMVSGRSFQPGGLVSVRFVGYVFEGTVVRKAIVDGDGGGAGG
jgi:molecular chaperone GrpE (heat shock protein)